MSAAQGGAWDGGPPGAEIDYAPRPSVGEQKVLPLPPSLSQWPPPLTFPPPYPFPAFPTVRPSASRLSQFPTDSDFNQAGQTPDFLPAQQQNSFHVQNQVRENTDDKYISNKPRINQDDRRYGRDDNCARRRSRSREFRRTRNDSSRFPSHKTSRRSRSKSMSRERKSNHFKRSSSSSSDRSSTSASDRRRRSASSSSSKSGPRPTPSSSDKIPRKVQHGKIDNLKKNSKEEHNTSRRNLHITSKNKSPNRSRSRERNPYQSRQGSGRYYPRSRSRSRERFIKRYDVKDSSSKSNVRSDRDSNKYSEKRSSSSDSNPRQKDNRSNARGRHSTDHSERDSHKKDHSTHSSGSRRDETSSASSSNTKKRSSHDTKAQIPAAAPFKNDGSFLEMFKKMQESQTSQDTALSTVSIEMPEPKKTTLPFIGKRRGGRVLKTGMVKKAKTIEEHRVDDGPKDAWSLYLQEVKKYRETSCEEEGKTRPLVK